MWCSVTRGGPLQYDWSLDGQAIESTTSPYRRPTCFTRAYNWNTKQESRFDLATFLEQCTTWVSKEMCMGPQSNYWLRLHNPNLGASSVRAIRSPRQRQMQESSFQNSVQFHTMEAGSTLSSPWQATSASTSRVQACRNCYVVSSSPSKVGFPTSSPIGRYPKATAVEPCARP